MLRKPVVAGRFYPASKAHLQEDVRAYLATGLVSRRVMGLISPHAGYVCSGPVAGAVFSKVNVPKRVIVISPNHTGEGAAVSLFSSGEWEIPTGVVPVDKELCDEILAAGEFFEADTAAHRAEHSLEALLPFLLERQPDVKIAPLTLSHLRPEFIEKVGLALAGVVKKFAARKEEVLIAVSSDMTHYEPYEIAKARDALAIEKIEKLDAKGLLDICARERITMCGVVPAAVLLVAAKTLGATCGELVKYQTSGDTCAEKDEVVGYAGMIVY